MTISQPLIARYPLPTVTSISPDLGDTAGGEILTITGTSLTRASSISIGGTNISIFSALSNTEIICQAPAHAAASGQSVLVTTPVGTNIANSLYEWWSPAELSLTGYWDRGNYQDVTMGTWPGLASAGSSSGRDLIQATTANQPAEVGLEPNFDGVSDLMTIAVNESVFFSAGAKSGFVLFLANTAQVKAGARYNDGQLFTSTLQNAVMGITTSGFCAVVYSGTDYPAVDIPVTLGALHLGAFTHNGTTLSAQVDGGGWSTIACASGAMGSGSARVGKGGSVYHDGSIRTLGVSNAVLSDANYTKLLKWARACRGLSQ